MIPFTPPKPIDYNIPVTRQHLDMDAYNKKFAQADKFLETNELDKDEYRKLLMDHSTFSYLNFKINNKRLKPYPYQDMILNDDYRFRYLECANQTGKSVTSNIQGGSNILRDHGKAHNECIISASLDLSKFQMRRIKQIMKTMDTVDWNEVEGDVDNVQAISVDIKDYKKPLGKQVKYSNLLLCSPCSAGSLGYDFHDMNLDEFEFWKDIDLQWFYGQVAKPRMYHTKGNIVITTNPNGAENYGAELTQQIRPNKTKKWHVYNFNYLDCPGNTKESLAEEKVGLTRAQIESTLMAIRTLSDKYYFSTDEVEQSYSEKLLREKDWYLKGKQSYWFLDVGAKHDQSALVGATTRLDEIKKDASGNPLIHVEVPIFHTYPVGYPISRVVGSFDETQATDGWHYEKSVKEYLDEYQLVKGVHPMFSCDVTGNSGISPLFKSVGIVPQDLTFSGPKKWAMYQRMKYFFEQKLLHVAKNKEYDYQMKRIVVTKLRTRTYNSVGHENEGDLDDVPDSVSGVIFMADNPIAVAPSVRFF